MLEAFLNLLRRHRAITLVVALLLLGVSAGALPRLTFNDSPERWLPDSVSEAWQKFGEHFEYGDTIAVGLEFHREVVDEDIAFLKALRADLKELPGVKRVIDVSFLAEEIECVPLTRMLGDPLEGEKDRYAAYRGVLFDDPRAWATQREEGEPKGRTLLTILDLNSKLSDGADKPDDGEAAELQEKLDQRRRGAVAGLYKVLEQHRCDDVTFQVIGGIVIQYELEKIARSMVITLVPLSLVFTLVALVVGFRSTAAVVTALAGGAWSMVVLLGGVALSGGSLNVVTVGGPPLMAVIVIATTVHFSHHYSQRRARGESSSSHGFTRWVAVPCFGASLAAGVGFLMLAFNELGPARELGIELFFGALLAFFGAFLLWLTLHPYRAAEGHWLSVKNLRACQRLVVAWPRVTVSAMLILTVIMVWASTRVRIDADPFSFFQPESSFATAIRHFRERKFGHYILDVVLVPKTRPTDPQERLEVRQQDMEVARKFERRIRGRPEVRNVVSALALQARLQSLQTIMADLRRVLAFRDMFKNWTVDQSGKDAIRITFTVYDPGEGFSGLMDEVRSALPEERFDAILSGTVASVVALTDGLVGGIVRGLGVALVVMAFLCGLLFRSVRLTALAFLPNAFPILFIFGLMGFCGIPLNSGSAMVATIALGMGLNDTVHFVMHYRRRRLEGEDPDEAVAGTFGEIGRPLVVTSAVNCFGFAIFLTSDFRPMYHFGLLASIAMVAALVGDLVLLPNLLKLFDNSAAGKTVGMEDGTEPDVSEPDVPEPSPAR